MWERTLQAERIHAKAVRWGHGWHVPAAGEARAAATVREEGNAGEVASG